MPNWPLPPVSPSTAEQRANWRKQGIMFRPIEEHRYCRSVFQSLCLSVPRSELRLSRKNWLVFDLLTTVEYAKTFPFFHKLEEADRLVLMKNVGLICYNLTQAYFSFENKSDEVIHPDGTNMVRPTIETP